MAIPATWTLEDLSHRSVQELRELYLGRSADELIQAHNAVEVVLLGQVLAKKYEEFLEGKRNEFRRIAATQQRIEEIKAERDDFRLRLELADLGRQPSVEDARLQTQEEDIVATCSRLKHIPPAARRFNREHTAAMALQSAWRQRIATMRVNRQLLSVAFGVGSDGHVPGRRVVVGTKSSQPFQAADGPTAIAQPVRRVLLLVSSVGDRLKQRGLNFESAFRCIDDTYPHNVGVVPLSRFLEQVVGRSGSVGAGGHRPRIGEVAVLLRLLRPTRAEGSVLAAFSDTWAGAALDRDRTKLIRNAPMTYELASDLSIMASVGSALAWPTSRSVGSLLLMQDTSESMKAYLEFKTDEFVIILRKMRDESPKFQSASFWHEVLSDTRDSLLVRPTPPSLAVLDAVPFPELVAVMLREAAQPIAPVSIYAAAATVAGKRVERRAGYIYIEGATKLDRGRRAEVWFEPTLPASPTMIHVTWIEGMPWSLDVDELHDRGITLRLRRKATCPIVVDRSTLQLWLRYVVGTASGQRVMDLPVATDCHYIPFRFSMRLRSPPACVLVETWLGTIAKVDLPHLGGGIRPVLDEKIDFLMLSAHPPQLNLKCLNASGFSIQWVGDVASASASRIWYEAESSEVVVKTAKLQELAPLVHMEGALSYVAPVRTAVVTQPAIVPKPSACTTGVQAAATEIDAAFGIQEEGTTHEAHELEVAALAAAAEATAAAAATAATEAAAAAAAAQVLLDDATRVDAGTAVSESKSVRDGHVEPNVTGPLVENADALGIPRVGPPSSTRTDATHGATVAADADVAKEEVSAASANEQNAAKRDVLAFGSDAGVPHPIRSRHPALYDPHQAADMLTVSEVIAAWPPPPLELFRVPPLPPAAEASRSSSPALELPTGDLPIVDLIGPSAEPHMASETPHCAVTTAGSVAGSTQHNRTQHPALYDPHEGADMLTVSEVIAAWPPPPLVESSPRATLPTAASASQSGTTDPEPLRLHLPPADVTGPSAEPQQPLEIRQCAGRSAGDETGLPEPIRSQQHAPYDPNQTADILTVSEVIAVWRPPPPLELLPLDLLPSSVDASKSSAPAPETQTLDMPPPPEPPPEPHSAPEVTQSSALESESHPLLARTSFEQPPAPPQSCAADSVDLVADLLTWMDVVTPVFIHAARPPLPLPVLNEGLLDEAVVVEQPNPPEVRPPPQAATLECLASSAPEATHDAACPPIRKTFVVIEQPKPPPPSGKAQPSLQTAKFHPDPPAQ